jgi:hypothetical protein
VSGPNTFEVTVHGVVTIPAHGFTVSEHYWLGTAGAITSAQPVSGIIQSLMYVRDANTLFIDIESPYLSEPDPFQYSAVEQTTGKRWIDGREIYVRHFDLSAVGNAAVLMSGVAVIVQQYGTGWPVVPGNSVPLPSVDFTTGNTLGVYINTPTIDPLGNLTVTRGGAFVPPQPNEFIIVEYVKL